MSKTYLGIDLHKKSSVWVLLDEDRNVIKECKVACHPLSLRLAAKSLPVSAKQVKAAVEPVCGWRWYSQTLEELGMDVKIANPHKTRLIADSKLKNDRVDAKALAELLRADFLPESYKAPDDVSELRDMIRHRAYLVRLRSSAKCRIHAICTRKGLHLTSHRPLLKAEKEKLENGDNEEIKNLLTVVRELDAHIAPIEGEISKISKENQTIKLLMSMPGVGEITGTAIYAEVGDFKRFKTPEELSSYAGLVPRERSSGKSIHMGHITKTGSKVLRYSVVEASFRIRNTEKSQTLYDFYDRLKPKCGAKKARVALARKMLSIMWYMVKNNTPYQDRSLKSTQSEVIS
jgi:transposase